MANTDSFIDEVSEEVRRDRLYALMRKWGWVPILVVVGIVGGAAYFEWQSAQQRTQAESFGDALLTALDGEDTQTRIAALEAVEVPSAEAGIILALLTAGEAANGDDRVGAAERLRTAAEAPGLEQRYSHLALLKAEMLAPGSEEEARTVLEALAAPGAPYSALAEEQLALMEIRAGDLNAGLDRLRAIERSAAATAGLQQRAGQLIVALESGAVLQDAPEVPVEEVLEEDGTAEEVPVEDAAAEPEPTDAAPAEEPAPQGAQGPVVGDVDAATAAADAEVEPGIEPGVEDDAGAEAED